MADQANVSHSPKRAGIYVRVSTATKSRQGDGMGYDQNPAVQEQPLRDLVAQRGWSLQKVYATPIEQVARPSAGPAWTAS